MATPCAAGRGCRQLYIIGQKVRPRARARACGCPPPAHAPLHPPALGLSGNLEHPCTSSTLAAPHNPHTPCQAGIVWALDPADGSIVWRRRAGPGGILGGMMWGSASDNDAVIVTNQNSFKAKLNLRGADRRARA